MKRILALDGGGIRGVFFTDAKTGTAVGGSSTILRTSDGGATWTVQQHPATNSSRYYGVFFSDANTGTVVGGNGAILRTTDGGDTWNVQPSSSSSELQSVSLVGPTNGWIGGNGGILHTATGGEPIEIEE